jgi:tetratricopeptide (TPR) repeat protein/transcriptional regulator with XRE-family HTH domain
LSEDPEVFGARLRARREAARLSQQELAERCGLSVRAVRNLERGRTRWPYRDTLNRLADVLELQDKARADFIAAADRQHRPAMASGATAAAHEDTRGAGTRVIPRLLPAAVPAFAGRQPELAVLSRMLDQPGGTAVITAIGGTAGVGKTALAVHWAHQVAAEFPDGQLFVNLRGFDPSGTPLMPAEAVLVLLEALEVTADRLPGTVEAQLGLYRSLLAGKRMLIVLDNARDEAQVRPLLPGALTCRVVITSRNQLAGLAAVESARSLLLDVLTDEEATQLLRQRIGTDRVAAEPDAARQLIMACARLPLALSIVAARAAMRPDLPLSQVADDLSTRLDLDAYATGTDPAADIRAVLSWSYRQLDTEAARTFRLAGLHPGRDLDRYAIAAHAGTTLTQADRVLGTLASGCLIQPVARDRYRMHDLLHRYAGELAGTQDSERARREALTRLLDYYLRSAADAMDAAFPAERHRRPRVVAPAVPIPVMPDKSAALNWLNTERAALVAAAVYAAANGWYSHATGLSATLNWYLDSGGYTAEAIIVCGSASHAAGLSGDHVAEAGALIYLGSAHLRQGRFQPAAGHYQQAIAIFSQLGDRRGEARAVTGLGLVKMQQGQLQEATVHMERGIVGFRETGDRANEANTLTNLGIAEHRQGRFDQAMGHVQRALALCREIGDAGTEAFALTVIGTIHLRQGNYRQAAHFLQQALAMARQTGERPAEADILGELGLAQLRQGQHQQAVHILQQALDLSRESHNLCQQAQVLSHLGEAYLCAGRIAGARARYAAALDVASGIGAKREQASAHHGLGQAYHESGDTQQARRHWQEALTLYTELGAPEADQVLERLASGNHISAAVSTLDALAD